jgi:hypothetical protein
MMFWSFSIIKNYPKKLKNAAAIVTTGMDENILGMHNIATDAVVIEARGLSPEKIGEMLDERLV